jgi:hypothetical protein
MEDIEGWAKEDSAPYRSDRQECGDFRGEGEKNESR